MKVLNASVEIDAPAEVVWSVVADTSRYPEWNPYHVRVAGKLLPGERLTVDIRKPNGAALTIHPRVLEFLPERSLVWGGGPAGIFRGVHRFDLEALSPACTRLHHTEVFSGIAVRFADLDAIEPGYRRMNEALRARLDGAGRPSQGGCTDAPPGPVAD